jgi:flagellar biosynthesis chaperone FliJ
MKLASDYKSMPSATLYELAKHSDNELVVALGELLAEANEEAEKVEALVAEKEELAQQGRDLKEHLQMTLENFDALRKNLTDAINDL